MLAGAVHMIDQEHAPAAMIGRQLGPLAQQPRLVDGDLPQRPIRRKRHEIRIGGEQQRILVALVGRPALARRHDFDVLRQAEIVALDLLRVAQQPRGQPARQGGLAHAFRSGEQQCLRQAVARDHLLQRRGRRAGCPRSAQTYGSTAFQISSAMGSMPARPSIDAEAVRLARRQRVIRLVDFAMKFERLLVHARLAVRARKRCARAPAPGWFQRRYRSAGSGPEPDRGRRCGRASSRSPRPIRVRSPDRPAWNP